MSYLDNYGTHYLIDLKPYRCLISVSRCLEKHGVKNLNPPVYLIKDILNANQHLSSSGVGQQHKRYLKLSSLL